MKNKYLKTLFLLIIGFSFYSLFPPEKRVANAQACTDYPDSESQAGCEGYKKTVKYKCIASGNPGSCSWSASPKTAYMPYVQYVNGVCEEGWHWIDLICGGDGGGGDEGDEGDGDNEIPVDPNKPTCAKMEYTGGDGWVLSPAGEYSLNSTIPIKYQAHFKYPGVRNVWITFRRRYWPLENNEELGCECWSGTNNANYQCDNGCSLRIVTPNPSGTQAFTVEISHPNLLSLITNIANKRGESITDRPWVVRVYQCQPGSNGCSTWYPECWTSEAVTINDCSETNEKPSIPTSITMGIDSTWTSPDLSTYFRTPTLIKYPYPSSTTNTSIPTIPAPPTSSGVGASININSIEYKANTGVFTINNQPASTDLTQGALGIISARNYTINKCDNNLLYSDARVGYYKVNTLPSSTAEIVGEDNPEYKGCVPELKYTGKHVNRTLTVTVSGTDPDDTNSINGAILWLVKDGSNITDEKELMTYVGPGDARADINKIGLFINSGGTVYIGNNSSGTLTGWGRNGVGGGTALHPVKDGNDVTIIYDVQLVQHGINLDTGKYEYKITLEFPDSSPLTGHYTLYTGMTDTLSYVQSSSIDQRGVSSTGPDWNFDFVNPTITNTNKNVDDTRILDLTWNSNDVGSEIRSGYTIVNAYKNELPRNEVTWVNVNPTETIPPSEAPKDTKPIGNYNVESGWRFPSSGENNLMKISTGENSNGTLNLYITAYDKACNFGQTLLSEINLNKWVNTKGGVFYSKGSISYATKMVDLNYFNLGTELISSTLNSIEVVLPYAAPNLHVNPAVAKGILDINNNSGQYTKLKENFDRNKGSLPAANDDPTGTVTCSFDTGCIWKTDTIKDITYSGKIIAYSDSDITIRGEIKNDATGADTNKDGLIIFSGDTITISGNTKTNSDTFGALETDIIDAWLLAKNNVILAPGETEAPYYYHDQVHVTGGIVAFGESGSSPAFQLKRTLGLFNVANPVLIIDYHPKYSSISELFFGLHTPAYKREVGFKPM